MTEEIAIATTSGKAYYRIVTELKMRGVPFLSLKPTETVPLHVKAVITTKPERKKTRFPRVLTYDEKDDPRAVVEKALQIIRGKEKYNQLVVGVDPGKRFGVAVVGDETVLKLMSASDAEDAANEVLEILDEVRADRKTVKIGDGARTYQSKLIKLLDATLPPDVTLESVREEGTTKSIKKPLRRRKGPRDVMSAVKISMRSGRAIERRRSRD